MMPPSEITNPLTKELLLLCSIFAFFNIIFLVLFIRAKNELDMLKKRYPLFPVKYSNKHQMLMKTKASNITSKTCDAKGNPSLICAKKAFSIIGFAMIVKKNAIKRLDRLFDFFNHSNRRDKFKP